MASPKKTPIAIIGGGITGLTTAALLERAGLDYTLIESQEIGGMIKGQEEFGFSLDYGLKSVPIGNDVNLNPLIKLKNRLDLGIQLDSWTERPQTLGKNEFTDFIGFGENKSRTLIEELNYYLQPERLLVSQGWQQLIVELLKIIPQEKILAKSHLTRINTEDDSVVSLSLNGSTILNANRVVYTLSPHILAELLPQGAISPKLAQRIAKTQVFTAISLDLATSDKISQAKNLFILNDNSDLDFFIIGQFTSNADTAKSTSSTQISSWLTLVDNEALQDDENGSKAIRTMKKLIKKMFPELIEKSTWERLLVVPNALGHCEHLKLEKNSTLPGITNLWIAGAQIDGPHRNVLNAINSGVIVADQLIRQLDPQKILKPTVENPMQEASPL